MVISSPPTPACSSTSWARSWTFGNGLSLTAAHRRFSRAPETVPCAVRTRTRWTVAASMPVVVSPVLMT
ncbi:hypothetical protein [Streptomyces globisporus]|uniref:hypothetical protein n=1 Tax=Streptomyces globisporus TaxID=1908 RepID=UPI0004C76FB2|nr:hypothetical protein [Streptomyces globisporus]